MILLIFSWLSVISLIISCFIRGFLSFLLMVLGRRLIEYSVILMPTIPIVKFTIRFSTIMYVFCSLTLTDCKDYAKCHK